MLDKIKSSFTINDLVNLTDISAHTIRIWERRFNLLKPKRTDSNIRRYDSEHLKKLLNISLLYQHGFKISKLALLSDEQLQFKLNEILIQKDDYKASINAFKISMLNFDSFLFEETFRKLDASIDFTDLFSKVLIPFLETIGTLWQTSSITPAHEHFIANLIRQKLFSNIEKLAYQKNDNSRVYLLFLPDNELHEIGLLFIHYSLLLQGKETIYLGQSVSVADLNSFRRSQIKPITYITYMTVEPQHKKVLAYLKHTQKSVLGKDDWLYVTGRKAKELVSNKPINNVLGFENAKLLIEKIK